jgi:HK97 family phage major capsid protein
LGRPIIPTQACQTLGDKGDIIFADLSQYMTAVKTGGLRTDVSIHLWFDYDTLAYRFILRIAGQPWWSSSISPKNGSNTLSPFVTLDERAG